MRGELGKVEEQLRAWYGLNAGTAFQWEGEDQEIFAVCDFVPEQEKRRKIEDALKQIPKQSREALRLLYFEKLTEVETEKVLGVSHLKLKNLQYFGLLRVKEILQKV